MLINVKMPFHIISVINITPDSMKARKLFIFHHFTFYAHLKFHAQLSMKKVL